VSLRLANIPPCLIGIEPRASPDVQPAPRAAGGRATAPVDVNPIAHVTQQIWAKGQYRFSKIQKRGLGGSYP